MGLFSGKSEDLIVTQLANHQAEMLAYIHSLMPGDDSVNDVLQRANLVIWKKRSTFKTGTNFRAWAFSIARWEIRAYLKERKRRSWLVIDDDLAQSISDTMQVTGEEETMHELRAALTICIKKLKPAERKVVTHRYHTDAPLKDYAKSSGYTVGTLKVMLCRIRAGLRQCIESQISIEQVKKRCP